MGWITYLVSLVWNSDGTVRLSGTGCYALADHYLVALPGCESGARVFPGRIDALHYIYFEMAYLT